MKPNQIKFVGFLGKNKFIFLLLAFTEKVLAFQHSFFSLMLLTVFNKLLIRYYQMVP